MCLYTATRQCVNVSECVSTQPHGNVSMCLYVSVVSKPSICHCVRCVSMCLHQASPTYLSLCPRCLCLRSTGVRVCSRFKVRFCRGLWGAYFPSRRVFQQSVRIAVLGRGTAVGRCGLHRGSSDGLLKIGNAGARKRRRLFSGRP